MSSGAGALSIYPPRGAFTLAKRLRRAVLALLALGALVVAGGVLALYLGGATWVANQVLRSVNPFPSTTLGTGRVSGNLLTALRVEDVRLIGADGRVAIRLDSLELGYDARRLASGDLFIREARVFGPSVDLRDFPRPRPRAPGSSPSSGGPRIEFGSVSIVGGRVELPFGGPRARQVLQVEDVEAEGSLLIQDGVRIRVPSLRARARATPGSPEWATLEAGGSLEPDLLTLTRVTVRSPGSAIAGTGTIPLPRKGRWSNLSSLQLHVVTTPLAYRDLAFAVPRLDRPGSVALTLDAEGQGSRVALRVSARGSDGSHAQGEGSLTAPGTAPVGYRASAVIRELDPSLLGLGAGPPDRVSGEVELDLSGPRADSMDGRARVRISQSRLGPLQPQQAEVQATFDGGRARLELKAVSERLRLQMQGWLRPLDATPSYDVSARLGLAREPPTSAWLTRLVGGGGPAVSVRVKGRDFDPRRADLRAAATLVPGTGPCGSFDSATVEARLTAGALDLHGWLGGTGGFVTFRGQATLAKELQYRLQGGVGRLNVAQLLGDTAASELAATFGLSGHGTSRASAAARAAITVTRATYNSHELTGGQLDLDLAQEVVSIAAQGTADGAGVHLVATALPFSSTPTVTVERLRLQHVDLARIVPGAGVASDLSGTARLRARGLRPDALRLAGRVELERSRIGGDTLERGTVEASLVRGDLQGRVRLIASAGRIDLSGTARPFDSIPIYAVREGTFRDLDLGRLLKRTDLSTRLAGSLKLEASGRKPETARLNGTLLLGPSTVNRASIRTGRLELGLADGRLRIAGRVLGDRDSMTIDASGAPFAHPGPVRLAGTADISDLAAIMGRDSLDAGLSARIRVEGDWDRPETANLRGSISGAGHFTGVSVDSLAANVRLANGMLELDTLQVRSNVGAAVGAGRFPLFARDAAAPVAARIDAKLADLAPLGPLLGLRDLAVDSARVTAALEGTRDRQHFTGGVRASDLALGARRARFVEASLEGDLGAHRSPVAATGDLLMQNLTGPKSRIARVRISGGYQGQELAVRGEAQLDRDRLGLLSARIYPDSAERRVEVDTLDFRSGEATWALKHPVRLTYGERLQVDDFALTSGKRGLTVDGVVDRRGEQRLVVRIDSLPIGWLGELAGIGAFDGDLSGALDLTGPAEGPNATGNLALDVRSRSKKVGRARLRLDWPGAGGLRLDAGVYHPEGDSLRIAGHVPLALSLLPGDSGGGIVRRIPGGTLSLYATAQHFRIDMARPMLDPATVKSLRGRLTVDAQARGSLESPELSGTLDLSDGKVQITRLGATYDKGRIRAAFHDDGIRLTEAQFASGNGRLDAEGTIRLRKSTPALDLNATLQDFRLADAENFRSTVSGKVHLGGTPAAPALTGSVDVKNLDFYLQASSGSQAEPIELTPADLRVLEDRFGLVADRPRRGEPSSLAMDLQVALAGNDWVRRRTSPAIAVELSGKLRIQKDSGQDFRIFGAIQPLAGRSFAEVLGRRFEVTSGEVGLNGPLKNARLALMAEYQADSGSTDTPSGVVITTRLTVDSGRVAVTLGSRPTMSDADVKSYLATGRPAGTDPTQTGEETNPLTAGASLAVSAALGSVAGGAGRALGLDVIQVLQDRNGAQTLVAGKYVSPPLYLGFRQPIVARDDPSESRTAQTTMEWEVEYAALRRALLNFQGSGNEFRAFLRMRRR